MAQSKEDQILGGVYLEDMEPHVPGVQPPGKVKNFSRPFVVPVYDPEGSNLERPPTNSSSTFGPVVSGSTAEGDPELGNVAVEVERYRGNPLKAEAQLGIRNERHRSFVSITPSDLPGGSSRRLSHGQIQELDRVVRHNDSNGGEVPTPLLEKGEDSSDEPPDGGCLAWAHALAGFLVTLNSQ